MNINETICTELNVKNSHGENIINLIDEGNTIPFIARYRKEQTGSMDDQLLRTFSDRLEYLRNLEKRKEEVIKSIVEQEKMTPELEKEIAGAMTLAKVEDIYRPYKPKKKTRASVAKAKGLEPLSIFIMEQDESNTSPELEAEKYITDEVPNVEEALQGAMDIIAETVSDSSDTREAIRKLLLRDGEIVCSNNSNEETSVYSDYYDFSQKIKLLPPHRILAMDRGEKEGFLKVAIFIEKENCLNTIKDFYIRNNSTCSEYIEKAIEDSYDRLLFPSMERERRSALTESAATSAISVFSENLKNLLLQAPVAGKVTLGLDPAYRTGCKLAVVDETGKPLASDVIYPTPPQNKVEEASNTVKKLIKKFNVDLIAIGNGTASRESEQFIATLIKEYATSEGKTISYVIVNEAGASVYSASKLAAKEFPKYDVSIRSAISIARRLQDPLAELVKIDPKSIGVGQYQHDMPKAQLENALGGVVESCVNSVGVDLNTASPSLLSYVAGITSSIADNLVTYRESTGKFKSRKELLKVPKLGPKAFEQCAGFLRISDGDILDKTGVHPESYEATAKFLSKCGYSLSDVASGNISDLKETAQKLGLKTISNELQIGTETLSDIIDELLRPGRDPREELEKPLLRSDVIEMSDLSSGMRLKGTVRNVIDFGAFVDIGVHQDGLVHISQICDRFIKHPSEVLKVGDIVDIEVMDVDTTKGRISLTMKFKNDSE